MAPHDTLHYNEQQPLFTYDYLRAPEMNRANNSAQSGSTATLVSSSEPATGPNTTCSLFISIEYSIRQTIAGLLNLERNFILQRPNPKIRMIQREMTLEEIDQIKPNLPAEEMEVIARTLESELRSVHDLPEQRLVWISNFEDELLNL